MVLEFVKKQKLRLIEIMHAGKTELAQLELSTTGNGFDKRKRKKYTKSYMHNYRYIPSGFWKILLELDKKKGYIVKFNNIDDFFNKVGRQMFAEWVGSLDLKYEPYDYQEQAAYNGIRFNTCRSEIATGGGKTLVAYLLSKFAIDFAVKDSGKKILVVVPSVMLVKQTAEEFTGYAPDGTVRCDTIFSGGKKLENSNVVIGNIDSLINYEEEYFSQFMAVIFDEAHKIKTAGYLKILYLVSKNRLLFVHSLSGTFHEEKSYEGTKEEAYLGPILIKKTARELMDAGRIANLKILQIHMHYTEEASEFFYYNTPEVLNLNKRFRAEVLFIKTLLARQLFISSLVNSLNGNTILIFKSVDYLKTFQIILEKLCTDKRVFRISGSIKQATRDVIKADLEHHDDIIVVATYQTIDTGVSINNLMNIGLAESTKSFIRVRQTIGRGLRLHPNKKFFALYDFVDVLHRRKLNQFEEDLYEGPKMNSTRMHGKQRISIYKQQKFDYAIKHIQADKILEQLG